MSIPDIERAQVRGLSSPGTAPDHRGGAQECVALLERTFVVRAHCGVAGSAGDEQLVDEPAALCRIAFDQGEVFRGEQDRAQIAEDIAGPADWGTVETRPIRLARVD